MLKEVDLNSLTVVHPEPVCIVQLLGEATVAGVRETSLWSFRARTECSFMFFIELSHELLVEYLHADPHSDGVGDYDVHDG